MLARMPLAAALRHYSTLFFLAAVVILPLHLALAYAFRKVIALAELHDAIASWPPDREISGVGAAEVGAYRRWLVVIGVLDLGALGILVGATRSVFRQAARGAVPTVAGALRSVALPRIPAPPGQLRLAIVPAAAGGGLWLAARVVGGVVAELFPAEGRWAVWALTEAGAVATGAPFVLAALAYLTPAKRSSSGRSTSTAEETST